MSATVSINKIDGSESQGFDDFDEIKSPYTVTNFRPLSDFEHINGKWRAKVIVPANDDATVPKRPVSGMEILSSGEWIRTWTPPNFIIKGIIQKRYLYTITAPTGHAKTAIAQRISVHVALGLPIGSHEVKAGRVLYLAGENPDDLLTRWIAQAERMGFDPETIPVDIVRRSFALTDQVGRLLARAKAQGRPYSLVIVDTAQAYFSGDDDNANVQQMQYAQTLRKLIDLPGGPAVIVLAHPNKKGDPTVPRGGSAFLNEIDANAYLTKQGDIVKLHQHAKWRGPQFAPLTFELVRFETVGLKDADGLPIGSIIAVPVSAADLAMPGEARDWKNDLIVALHERPGAALTELAKALGLENPEGTAATSKVYRERENLAKFDPPLVEKRGTKWFLSAAGEMVFSEIFSPEKSFGSKTKGEGDETGGEL